MGLIGTTFILLHTSYCSRANRHPRHIYHPCRRQMIPKSQLQLAPACRRVSLRTCALFFSSSPFLYPLLTLVSSYPLW
ncbi:hypothetical protein PITC_043690 [Penicillium italicum]|uniref:Uncharacterized protein n=1 Tax=Penicillium italicum TaxID=40296 RepID=A0A0A2L6N6_PENIT|nr:hypothetical protein PITC_043690 [Penicillium italicum]